MPKAYKKKRKKFLKKHKNNKTVSMILPGPHVVPDEMIVRLRYNISATHSGVGLQTTDLNGNNPNAVFVGGTGENAAMGMQEWTNFYNRYQVIGSKFNCDFLVDTDPSLKKAIKVAVVPFAYPADSPTTIEQASEMTYGKSKLLAENQNKAYNISNYMATKKLLGYHNSIDDITLLHGNTASGLGPTQQWVWSIYTDSLSAGAYDIQIDGYMDYYVRLFGRRALKVSITPP